MDDIAMPASFPDADFRGYGLAAVARFPPILSEENLHDPQETRRHFQWSWQAVRYRYRSCAECSEDFEDLQANPSQT